MPIVYILKNQSMPNTIKIGITENLERRIKELDNTSVPLPFECVYAVKVKDASKIEKLIHEGLDNSRIRDNREFFDTTPEQAQAILKIAEVMGGENVTPTEDIVETQQDKEALEKSRKIRRRFNFQMINLEPGTTLEFSKDKTITCEVHDETKVKFRNEITSLSNSADIILKEMGYEWSPVQGPRWWTYAGKSLSEIRNENES